MSIPSDPPAASEEPLILDERLRKRLQGRPEVAVNFALTWDARISTRERTPSTFSSAQDKARMQEIRASADALLVARGTLEADRMQLGVTVEPLRAQRVAEGRSPSPLRVVISKSGRFSMEMPLFKSDFAPTIIFSTEAMPMEVRVALLEQGVTLYLSQEEEISLRWMLETLYAQHAVRRVVCEGGPTLFHALLGEDLIDELNLTFCPLLFGGEGAASLTGLPGAFLAAARGFRLERMEVVGGECFAHYRV